ncbi:fluoride efflux transporter CrcB [Sporomusa sp. KB1]|uniref:fluoride efflux transporter CrcB n=1 Tax=Sporomusa sp. KB1 TaxID=943346 RepID=UPI0011ABB7BF|nr:fluoride efflux transporter CrcB [Sporomusa sp. KB1]TWH52078.1 CrcB protein [Sporomusa sp. KB1]
MRYFAVAVGGFLGAIARFGMGQLFVDLVNSTGFPWGTLVINLLGCFILSLFLTVTLDLLVISPFLRLGFSTGFLGAFTTFSTFSLETVQLFFAHQYWYVGLYLFSSIFLCIAMSAFGFVAARGVEKIKANRQADIETIGDMEG